MLVRQREIRMLGLVPVRGIDLLLKCWCLTWLRCVTVWGAILLCVVTVSCVDRARPVERRWRPEDSLEYLVGMADLVAVVEVREPGIQHNGPLKADTATIRTVLKGDALVGAEIRLAIGVATGGRYAHVTPNRQYLAFLKSLEDGYVPLTDMAMAKIQDGYVLGIWNRRAGTELSIVGELAEDVYHRIHLKVTGSEANESEHDQRK